MSIDRLSALDRFMLDVKDAWSQDIGALVLLDGSGLLDGGRLRIDVVKEAILSRLHLVPRFRQHVYVPRRGLGGPLWVDDPAFDLTDHVRVLELESPATEADLLAATEILRREPLNRSRPLWELWFITGLPNQQIGLYVKMHHAIADGMAALANVGTFLDTDSEAAAAPAPMWVPTPLPSPRALLTDNIRRRFGRLARSFSVFAQPRTILRRAVKAWPATSELLAERPGVKTSLDGMVGPDRLLAVVRSALVQIKEIAHFYNATANDVLLALTAGGLRALLLSRGEPVDDLIVRIYVPVSLRRDWNAPAQGNLVAQMVVPLPLGESHPGKRLRLIAAETARRKARTRTELGTLFNGRIARQLMLMAVIRQRVNVTSASIPGPPAPVYFAGAQVLEVFPILPLIGNVPLGVGALSYAGTFNIGITADRETYPDIEDFVSGVCQELQALGMSLLERSRQ